MGLTFCHRYFADDPRLGPARLLGFGDDRRLRDGDAFANGRPEHVRPGHDLVHDRVQHLLHFRRQVALDATAIRGRSVVLAEGQGHDDCDGQIVVGAAVGGEFEKRQGRVARIINRTDRPVGYATRERRASHRQLRTTARSSPRALLCHFRTRNQKCLEHQRVLLAPTALISLELF